MSSVIRGSDNMDSAGVEEGKAKAWANFNGTGVVTIRDSFNVSSVTDNGVGLYTVNFTTPMPDVNYCILPSATQVASASINVAIGVTSAADILTTSVALRCQYSNGGDIDADYIGVSVHSN